jgi:hypothetical protein
LSDAFADTVTADPETADAVRGAVNDTVGSVVSLVALLTVTVTLAAVAVLPAARGDRSQGVAAIAAVVVFQLIE